jgi:hypothetical protein
MVRSTDLDCYAERLVPHPSERTIRGDDGDLYRPTADWCHLRELHHLNRSIDGSMNPVNRFPQRKLRWGLKFGWTEQVVQVVVGSTPEGGTAEAMQELRIGPDQEAEELTLASCGPALSASAN